MSAHLQAVERSCYLAWLHLVSAGLVTDRPDDVVTLTLAAVLQEARDAELVDRRSRRRWTS